MLLTIGKEGLDGDDVSRIQEVIVETGAEQVIEREIKDLTDAALQVLETSHVNETALDALRELAIFVAYRTY